VTAKCTRGHKAADRRCSSRCSRWYFIVEGPHTAEGKRRRLWSTGFSTRKAAEVALRDELHRRDQGIALEPEKVTLAAFADRWLDYMATLGRDERTLERYGELLRLHVLPTLGGLQLKALTPAHLSDLYGRLLRDGRRDGRAGGLSPRTVGHVHRCVHRMLKQALRWRLLAYNPAADLELPSVAPAPMVTLTHEQARALLGAAQGWMYTLVLLGLATGARLGELLALRWVDVDLDTGTVRIGRSLRVVRRQLQVKGPKTQAGYRTVVLGPTVLVALRRLRVEQAERRLALGGAYQAVEDLVICKLDGRPYRPDSASTRFRQLVRQVGLPEAIHVHTCGIRPPRSWLPRACLRPTSPPSLAMPTVARWRSRCTSTRWPKVWPGLAPTSTGSSGRRDDVAPKR
jgi:integrase